MPNLIELKATHEQWNEALTRPSLALAAKQDSHKSVLLSVNVVGAHLAEHTADAARGAALRRRLADVSEGWDGCCEEAATWQTKLQTALLEVSESAQSMK